MVDAKKIINHQHFPVLLGGVIALWAYSSDWKWQILIILSVPVILEFINIAWLEEKYNLIKKYHLLMKHLERLSCENDFCNQKIKESIQKTMTNPQHLTLYLHWKNYFELNEKRLNRNFNILNNKINKIVGIRYRLLWWTNVNSIEDNFIWFLNDVKSLCELVLFKQGYENVMNTDVYDVQNEYVNFLRELEKPEYYEIRKKIPKELMSAPKLLLGGPFYGKS